MATLIAHHHVGPVLSGLFVLVSTSAVLVVLIASLLRWLTSRAMAREAEVVESALDDPRPLQAGPVVLRGRVRLLGGRAVRVEIDQAGEEAQGKGGSWSHSWSEVNRRVEVHPFALELVNRERVAVVPPTNVYLVDDLDQVRSTGRKKRTLAAELTEGEEVNVSGSLRPGAPSRGVHAGGYRDAPSPTLELGPHRGQMLVSSQLLAQRFRERMRFHLAWVGAAVLALGVLHSVCFGSYDVRLFRGNVVQARVTGHRGNLVHAHPVGGGAQLSSRVDPSSLDRARPGQVVPFIVVPGWPGATQIGRHPTILEGSCFWAVVAAVVFLASWIRLRESSRAWQDRKSVDEEGRGRLPEEDRS